MLNGENGITSGRTDAHLQLAAERFLKVHDRRNDKLCLGAVLDQRRIDIPYLHSFRSDGKSFGPILTDDTNLNRVDVAVRDSGDEVEGFHSGSLRLFLNGCNGESGRPVEQSILGNGARATGGLARRIGISNSYEMAVATLAGFKFVVHIDTLNARATGSREIVNFCYLSSN